MDIDKATYEKLLTIEDKLDEILERMDRLDEAITNISAPTSGYSIFSTDED